MLQFNKDVFNVGEINTLPTPLVDKVNNSLVQAQLWGKNVGICIVGSNLARDFDAIGDSAFIDYALATMESMFGSSVSGARVCVSSGPDVRVRSATSFSYAGSITILPATALVSIRCCARPSSLSGIVRSMTGLISPRSTKRIASISSPLLPRCEPR